MQVAFQYHIRNSLEGYQDIRMSALDENFKEGLKGSAIRCDIVLSLAFLLLVCVSISWTIVDIATTKPTKGKTPLQKSRPVRDTRLLYSVRW